MTYTTSMKPRYECEPTCLNVKTITGCRILLASLHAHPCSDSGFRVAVSTGYAAGDEKNHAGRRFFKDEGVKMFKVRTGAGYEKVKGTTAPAFVARERSQQRHNSTRAPLRADTRSNLVPGVVRMAPPPPVATRRRVVCALLLLAAGTPLARSEGDFLGAGGEGQEVFYHGCHVIRKGELHLRWRVVNDTVDFALEAAAAGLLAPGRSRVLTTCILPARARHTRTAPCQRFVCRDFDGGEKAKARVFTPGHTRSRHFTRRKKK